MMDLVNITIPNAGLTALLGYLVVFLGLVLLMVVVMIQGKIMAPKKPAEVKAAPAAAETAPAAAALPKAPGAAGEVVKSPMPGNILKINVAQGQAVKEGDVLIVLEAMKMENEITAPKSGSVAQIAVSKGQVVETGSPLVVIA